MGQDCLNGLEILSIENRSAQNFSFPKILPISNQKIDEMFNKRKVFSFSEMFYELKTRLEATDVDTALIVHINYNGARIIQ